MTKKNFEGTLKNFDLKIKLNMEKQTRVTPKFISKLSQNEIFVFGSNLRGMHGGGAARTALKWGAIMGQGVGLQGQTYAIPTMFDTAEEIQPYVDEFIKFAKSNSDKRFLVTPIGCGIAGFSVDDIAPLFDKALEVSNIYLPKEFLDYLNSYRGSGKD